MFIQWKQLPYKRLCGSGQCRSLSISTSGVQKWMHDRLRALRTSVTHKLHWGTYADQKCFVTCGSTVTLVFGISYILLSSNEKSSLDLDQALWKAFPKHTTDGKQILIPPQRAEKKGWKTLVLDMDEMLVGNTTGIKPYDSMPMVHFADGSFSHVHRPNLKAFLEYAAANFEVVLWTAGTKEYAEECIRNMLHVHSLKRDTFDFVIARDRLWFEITPTSWYQKDLTQLDRPLDHVLMFENAPVVRPSTNAVIVPDYHYPKVIDTYAGCRERDTNRSMDYLKMVRASMRFGGSEVRSRPETPFSEVTNSTRQVVPCTSLSSEDDATLFTAHEIIRRWNSSTKAVAEFLKEEIENGVLFRAHIQPHRTNQSEAMATLPLHRKATNN